MQPRPARRCTARVPAATRVPCVVCACACACRVGPYTQAGHLLGHVTDLGLTGADPSVRIYQTAERQTFHTDRCDLTCLGSIVYMNMPTHVLCLYPCVTVSVGRLFAS